MIGYPRIPWSDTLESLLCPFVSFFLEKKLLHFNSQFTLSQSFQHDLSQAVKILAKSSPIPVLDYNWPPPDLAAVSMSSSKGKVKRYWQHGTCFWLFQVSKFSHLKIIVSFENIWSISNQICCEISGIGSHVPRRHDFFLQKNVYLCNYIFS